MKKKLLSMLLAISMVSSSVSPVLAAEFSDGDSVVVDSSAAEDSGSADTGAAESGSFDLLSDFTDSATSSDSTASLDSTASSDSSDSSADADSAEDSFSDSSTPELSDGSAEWETGAAETSFSWTDVDNVTKAAAKKLVSDLGITAKNSDLEKLCMIMSWFRKYTFYEDDDSISGEVSYTAYAALVLRRSHCGGFNEALNCVLSECGIKSRMCVGDKADSVAHAWTEVLLNGSWYVVDATAACYQPGTFLEDYNNFWYHPDIIKAYKKCSSNYSVASIDGYVYYLGASGNTLYARSEQNYYKNNGKGWVSINAGDVPAGLYGSGDITQSSDTSVVDISCHFTDSVKGKNILKGAKTYVRFYVSTENASKISSSKGYSCQSSDPTTVSASIKGAGGGYIDVNISGLKLGKSTISLIAPNGVTGAVDVTVSYVPTPKITVCKSPSGGYCSELGEYVSIRVELEKGKETDYCIDGYQLCRYNEKTGKWKTYPKSYDLGTDGEEVYLYDFYSGDKGCNKFRVRAYTEDKNGKRTYGKYSDPITFVVVSSAKANGNKKITVKWNASDSNTTYQVYRKDGAKGKYKKVKTLTGKTSFTDKKLKKGVKYYYKVKVTVTRSNGQKYSFWTNTKGCKCK